MWASENSSLLLMSQASYGPGFITAYYELKRQKNQRFSAIFKKSKVNFVLEVILFLWTKGF